MTVDQRARQSERLFPALLKYWRGQRGLSQLDLGLAADVSSRHISFLETGRSSPSVEMVLLLSEVLDVPLRDRNDLLRAGGFEAKYPEPALDEILVGPLRQAVEVMLAGQEPYPMVVLDRLYNVLLANNAAASLTAAFLDDGVIETNLMRVLFAGETAQRMVTNWNDVASDMLRRLQRELLHAPQDDELRRLHDDLVNEPSTPPEWRTLDLADPAEPFLPIRLRLNDGAELSFLTTITAFNAPHNVTLDEIRIESWFPSDDATTAWCRGGEG